MHQGENHSASKKQIKTCIFTQIRLEGDYLLSNMITFCFLYRKKPKHLIFKKFMQVASQRLQMALNPRLKMSAASPHTSIFTEGPLWPLRRLATSQNRMDQKAAASANGSSSTFKCVSTQRVVQTWSERSHSLMQTKYSSTACHRSKIVLWLCSPLIECISLLQLWDIYDEFLLASSLIFRRVNYLGIYN